MCNIHGFHFDCVCVVGVRGGVSTALHPPLHSILLSPAQAVLKLHTTHKHIAKSHVVTVEVYNLVGLHC